MKWSILYSWIPRLFGKKRRASGSKQTEENLMKFYDVQIQSSVSIPDKDCTKCKIKRKDGKYCYAVKAVSKKGHKLTLFVGESTWKALPCKQTK